jgi:hypothetical protein
MADLEDSDLTLLYVSILFACLLSLTYETWKGVQFGQWNPFRLTAATLVCIASVALWIREARRPKT